MKEIKRDELKQKLDNKEVILIEVLNREKYEKSHIKGAINIPLEEIGAESKERFNKNDQIVVYCSDHECTASPKAAKKLEDLGFENVYHYKGGKKDWKESDFPME
jgi:rhodanese-related sulfurtransferase